MHQRSQLSLFFAFALCLSCSGTAPEPEPEPGPGAGDGKLNVAYVEVNSNDIENVGIYVDEDGRPVFDIAVIFAANINYDEEQGRAVLHLNPQVSDLLDHNLHKVRGLQTKGIRVVLDVLGNHQNAGWSCFDTYAEAEHFAATLKAAVDYYGLDGIDIDDEYSKCERTNRQSLIMVTRAMKLLMPDKLISKAVWSDLVYFDAEWNGHKLHEQLDYMWEMTYGASDCESRVQGYLNRGVPRAKLGVGVSTSRTSKSAATRINSCVIDKELGGGLMVFNLRDDSAGFLRATLGHPVEIRP